MLTRRGFLMRGGLALAGLALPSAAHSRPRGAGVAGSVVEIRMRSEDLGAEVWFDPIGVHIESGQTVRWIMNSPGNPHTTTAYHPMNGSRSLRIPEAATPWDSGFLINAGDRFEVTLTVDGVYDYFCLPHEAAGMVGRIVVGRPSGPGTLPFDYFAGRLGTQAWVPVPEAARAAFPSVAAIASDGVVRRARAR
jgi:plastocyanin